MILFLFIIATLFYIGFHSSASHFFDKKTVTALKPFLAIGIVLHHLCSESVYLHEFERWGPLIVGIFFFISGYGLFFSLQNKKDYAQNFFRDRILQKILLPYIIVIIFDFILNKRWINYSFISHILNNSGPTFFSK